MRLLKAIGRTLVCAVAALAFFAAVLAWAAFCQPFGVSLGPVVFMAPFVVIAMVALTWLFYKEQG